MDSFKKYINEEVDLVEGNIDKIKDIVSKKQHSKIDGVMVDLFTASAISQIYDKVNDANKKKMEKLPIIKLADLAMKMMQKEEVELGEAISGNQYYYVDPKGVVAAVGNKAAMRKMNMKQAKDGNKGGSFSQNLKKYKVGDKIKEETELGEAKSGTGYDLYHKDFSSAMKHAYDHAKKKHGITVDSSEIDNKVATGPAKPKEGKTNTYRLKGDKGSIQVQVYNKGGSKPFELNMYKEEVDLDEGPQTDRFNARRTGKEGTVKIIKNKDGKFQIQKMTKGKFADIGKPYNSQKEAEKFRSGGQPNLFGEEVELGEAKFTVKYDKNGKNYTDIIMAKDKDDAVQKALNTFLKGIKGNKFSVRPVREEEEVDEGTAQASLKSVMALDKKNAESKKQAKKYQKRDDANRKSNRAAGMEEVELDEAEAGIKVQAGPDHDRKVKRIQNLAKQLGAKVTNVGKSTDGKMSTIHVKGNMKVINDLMKLRTEEVEVDEARGRPRKDGTKSDSDDREQIQMQLRKSISLRGLKDVVFDDGKKVKISARDARDILGKLDAIKAPRERQNAVIHIAKSHKNLVDFAKGKAGEMDPEQRRKDAANSPFKKK